MCDGVDEAVTKCAHDRLVRNGRPDATDFGDSRRSRIFPGNVSEPSTLPQMIDALRTNADAESLSPVQASEPPAGPSGGFTVPPVPELSHRLTIVMAAGIASEDNIAWRRDQGYPDIVVSRKRHLEFGDDQAADVKAGEHDAVRAMRVEATGGEIELYCHTERREAKERAIKECTATRFEQKLN